MISLIYFCNKSSNYKINKFKKEIIEIFPVKYRKVIEELVKSNGEIAQSILRQKLGVDKVYLHRLLKRTEEEGFIKVKKRSKINFVELNDRLKEFLLEQS